MNIVRMAAPLALAATLLAGCNDSGGNGVPSNWAACQDYAAEHGGKDAPDAVVDACITLSFGLTGRDGADAVSVLGRLLPVDGCANYQTYLREGLVWPYEVPTGCS